jgi:hypothetical protein
VDGGHGYQVAHLRGLHGPEGQPGAESAAAEVGQQRISHLLDGVAQHIGIDRAPQRRRRPAPDGPERAERPAREVLDRDRSARVARVVRSDKLWNSPRAVRSSTSERSPANHAVNITRPRPGSAVAASVVRSP